MYVLAGTPNIYSKPRLLITSTMKSEPGRSIVAASSTTAAGAAGGRVRIGALALRGGATCCCALPAPGVEATRAALAAAVFRKFRRSTRLDDFLAMESAPLSGWRNFILNRQSRPYS